MIIRVTSIFKLVYTDTAHIIPIGINGATGFNDLTNNYSRYYHINIYIQKKDAFQNLINFQIKIKTQYGRGIRRLRVDNGKEYGIQKLQEWADQKGIDIEYVPPYTPNQADVAFIATYVNNLLIIGQDKAII